MIVYVYVEPVSAVAIWAPLPGESFGVRQGLGAVLAFAAVWIASAPRADVMRAAQT